MIKKIFFCHRCDQGKKLIRIRVNSACLSKWSGYPTESTHVKLLSSTQVACSNPPTSPLLIKGHISRGQQEPMILRNRIDSQSNWVARTFLGYGRTEKIIRELGEFSVLENYRQNLVLSSGVLSQRKKG